MTQLYNFLPRMDIMKMYKKTRRKTITNYMMLWIIYITYYNPKKRTQTKKYK